MIDLSLKDTIGVIADLMAIFGLGGFFTWAFVRKTLEGVSVADAGVTTFAYSVKIFLIITSLVLLSVPVFFSHFGIILFSSGNYGQDDGIWNTQKAFSYLLAYVVTALWAIPVAVLSVGSIFTWSIEPYRRFFRALKQ
jgi:hypothetical protein